MHDVTDRGTPNHRRVGDGTAKKPYHKPRIEDFGSVVEMTGTGTGTIEDAGAPGFDFSGAAG